MNRSWHWQMQQHRNFLRLSETVYSGDRAIQSPGSITTTLDPTTLVAFLFKAPPEARTVELLGSWDNFSQPYPMHHDRRKGTGFWSGCFKFRNIIFDGDSSHWTKPRTGGLKQGGTYWYYYRLNDEAEAYDNSQDYTTCPLLPGQTLNVIEVPIEVVEPPPRCRSASTGVAGTIASLPSTHTLDPGDKFAALDPPPVSRVHGRCMSDVALNRRSEVKARSLKSSIISVTASSSTELQAEQCHSPVDRPTERYYATEENAYDHYEDGASSLHSRRSWRSAAPSGTHSSVTDAYGAESHAFDVDSFDLYPVQESSSWTSGPVTTVPYEDYSQFDFSIQNVHARPGNMEDSAEGEYETTTDPPASIGEFNFFDTRPTTSYSRAPSHSQMFSAPQEDFHEYPVSDNWAWSSEGSPRHSDDQRPEGESHPFDDLSPTFSAATLSSRGLNTPFRLSVGCSRTASASANHDDSIESVAERLRNLGSDEHDGIPPIYESDEPAFTGYALPEHDMKNSTQSLGKLPPAHDIILNDIPLPSLMQETHEGSFADAVFSELGFLGGSIA